MGVTNLQVEGLDELRPAEASFDVGPAFYDEPTGHAQSRSWFGPTLHRAHTYANKCVWLWPVSMSVLCCVKDQLANKNSGSEEW